MSTTNHTCRPSRRSHLPILALVLALAACNSGGGAAAGNAGGAPAPTPAPPANPPNAQPAFARLWLPNFNAAELRTWNRASLLADRDNAPDVVVRLPNGSRPNAATFDATGNLYVTDNQNARILLFTRAQLQVSGQPTPAVVIDTDGTSLQNAIGLAFDRDSNLWVAAGGRLEMYEPENLDDSGPTTPNRVVTAAGLGLPADLTFDAGGNLWLSNASFTAAQNSVVVFTPDQLAAGGQQVPRLVLRSNAFALIEGLRFDAQGSLWVASNDGLNIAKFAAADLVLPATPATRNLVPAASLTANGDDAPTGRSVRKPGGIVFDSDGSLWVNSQRGNQGGTDSGLLQFTAAQLAFSGPAAVPANVLVRSATSNPGFGGMVLELP